VSNRLELALYAVHHRLLTNAAPGSDPAAGPPQAPPRPPWKRRI